MYGDGTVCSMRADMLYGKSPSIRYDFFLLLFLCSFPIYPMYNKV